MATETERRPLNCQACAELGETRKATHTYEMFTARATIPMCDEHAEIAKKWSGALTRL